MTAVLDATLSALADPARRHVVELLRQKPRRAGELAAADRMSAPAMSRHLRVLRTSGLVEATLAEDDAREHIYHLRAEPFMELQAWLTRIQEFWEDQLDSFRAHVIETRRKQG